MATRMRKRSMERAMAELRSMFVEGAAGEDEEEALCLLAVPPAIAAADMLRLLGGTFGREGWWRHGERCVWGSDGGGGVYEMQMVACAVLYYTL